MGSGRLGVALIPPGPDSRLRFARLGPATLRLGRSGDCNEDGKHGRRATDRNKRTLVHSQSPNPEYSLIRELRVHIVQRELRFDKQITRCVTEPGGYSDESVVDGLSCCTLFSGRWHPSTPVTVRA